jgi:hypothetical protein
MDWGYARVQRKAAAGVVNRQLNWIVGRSLYAPLSVGIAGNQGHVGELSLHIKGALTNGVTKDEMARPI